MLHVIIKCKTAAQLRSLRKLRIDIKDHSAFLDENDYLYKVAAIISDDDKQKLESQGYEVQILSDLRNTAKARLKEVSRTNRFRKGASMADFQGFTVFGGYMTVEEIESAMKELANIHPDLVELIELPNKTWENRTSRSCTPSHRDKCRQARSNVSWWYARTGMGNIRYLHKIHFQPIEFLRGESSSQLWEQDIYCRGDQVNSG